MNNEITSFEQLHELMTRTIEGIGRIGQQLVLIERAGYSPEEYHRQRDLMFTYLIHERAKLDYYKTLSESYMTVLHDYEMLRLLNQGDDIGALGVSQADKKQLEEEIIRLSAVLPEGLKQEIGGTPVREAQVQEEITSIEDLDRRIRDEQDDLVRLHEEARRLDISVLDGEAYQERKVELDRAFAQIGENLARYISMKEDYSVVRSNRERIRKLGSITPRDEAEKLELEASIRDLERENERKSANLTPGLLESMAEREQKAEVVARNSEFQEKIADDSKVVEIDNIREERDSKVQEENPMEEPVTEEQPEVAEEEKEINIDNNEEKEEKEINPEVEEKNPMEEPATEEQPEVAEEEKDINIDNNEEKEGKEIDIDNIEEKESELQEEPLVDDEERLDVELQELRGELSEAEERLQNSKNAMQEVYDFTRNYRENNLYSTVEELDSANQAYLEIMSSLNDRFIANRVEVERLRREVERIETLQRERTAEHAKVLVKEKQPEEIEERQEEVQITVPEERIVEEQEEYKPVEIGEGQYGPDHPRESEVQRVLDDYENLTGRKLLEGEYEVIEDGANGFRVVLTNEPPVTEEVRNEEAPVVPIEIVDDSASTEEAASTQTEEKEQTTAVAVIPENIFKPAGGLDQQQRDAEVQEEPVEVETDTTTTEQEEVVDQPSTGTRLVIPSLVVEDFLKQSPEQENQQQRDAEVQEESVEVEPDTTTTEQEAEAVVDQKDTGRRIIIPSLVVEDFLKQSTEQENQQQRDEEVQEEPVEQVVTDTTTEEEPDKGTDETYSEEEQPEEIEIRTDLPQDEYEVVMGVADDDDEEEHEEEPVEEQAEEIEQPKRGLQTIVASILVDPETGEPINMTVKQKKRFEKSNISITGALKNGLTYGNYLYNLTSIAPTIIGVIPNTLMKLAGKVMLTRRAKENIRIVRENLANLPDEDMEVLYRQFKGDNIVNLRGAAAVTGLIKEAIERYQERKYIAPKRAEMKITYAKILSDYEQMENNKVLIHQITSGTMSSADAETLIEKLGVANLTQAVALLEMRNNRLMSTKAEEIRRVRELREELLPELSSGKHGTSEDIRATDSKMNLQARRFAKDISTGAAKEMMTAMGQLQDAEMAAVARGDNETALQAFIKLETTQARESKIEGSIFGRRDAGLYHYTPIPEELDYRQDPFVRNLLTTVTTAAIVKGLINEVHNRMLEADLRKANADRTSQQQVIDDVNQRNAEASAHNASQQQAVQQSSSQLTQSASDVRRGMQAQVDQNVAATRSTHEYMDGDATGWSFNDAYHAADRAHHTAIQNAAEDAQNQLAQIQQDLAAGRITDVQAMREIAQVNSDTHAMFQQAVQEAIPVFKDYVRVHPQFEYGQYIEALERLGSDPTAIDALNQSAINAVEIGQSLQGVTILPYEQLGLVLEAVPSGIRSQLFLLGSAALMTGQAATQAQQFSKQSDNEEIISALETVVENDETRSERHTRIDEAVNEAERSNEDELRDMTSGEPAVEETAPRTR